MKKERCRKNQLLSLFLSTILAVIFVGCRSFTSEYISYEDINPDFVMHLDRAWVLDKYIGDADVVVVPERVERIGEAAFCGKSMSEVVLPEGIVDIGEAAFEYCTNLKIVDFPSTVRTIGKRAFFDAIVFEK